MSDEREEPEHVDDDALENLENVDPADEEDAEDDDATAVPLPLPTEAIILKSSD